MNQTDRSEFGLEFCVFRFAPLEAGYARKGEGDQGERRYCIAWAVMR
jgi:hypothetical protein